MIKLAVIATATQLAHAGCVIETHRNSGDVASISARWSLRNMLDGAVTGCPKGFDTVQLVMLPLDDRGDALGQPTVDLFDCGGGIGLSDALVPDLYQVWIEVRSHDLASLYAQSLSQVLDVRKPDQPFATDVLNDGGYFQLTWDLVGKTTNRPLGCTDVVGLDTITAISTSVSDPRRVYDDRLTCEDGTTVTRGLLQGAYTVSITVSAAGKAIGQSASLTNKPISGQNRVTDLGHLSIAIDGQ